MNQEQYIIPLPISIIYNKEGGKFYLNLSQYRNTHFQTLNKTKILFEDKVKPLVAHLPKIKKLSIMYTLFTDSKRSVDLANICCIVDKYFCDTIVNAGILTDDSIEVISVIDYRFGNVDKENPRVEATLLDIQFEKDEPMRIIVTADEVQDLIIEHVRATFSLAPDHVISVDTDGDATEYNVSLNPPKKTGGVSVKSALAEAFEAIPVKAEEAVTTPLTSTGSTVQSTETKPPQTVSEEVKSSPVETSGTEAPTGVVASKSLFANLPTKN